MPPVGGGLQCVKCQIPMHAKSVHRDLGETKGMSSSALSFYQTYFHLSIEHMFYIAACGGRIMNYEGKAPLRALPSLSDCWRFSPAFVKGRSYFPPLAENLHLSRKRLPLDKLQGQSSSAGSTIARRRQRAVSSAAATSSSKALWRRLRMYALK